MWRSAVQVCLGLHFAARQCVPQADASLPGTTFGGLAQLARAPALQAGGQRFESVILHIGNEESHFPSFFDMLAHKTVSEDLKLETESLHESRRI